MIAELLVIAVALLGMTFPCEARPASRIITISHQHREDRLVGQQHKEKRLAKRDSRVVFKIGVREKGRHYSELVEINKARQTEFVHVPAHLGLDEAEYLHDFVKNITMIKLPRKKMCYLSKLEVDLPRPADLEKDFQQPISPSEEVLKEVTEWRISGLLKQRNILTLEMRQLCSGLPVYRLAERNDDHISVLATSSQELDRRSSCGSRLCMWARKCVIPCPGCSHKCDTVHFYRKVSC
ncbi:uncharacterized protein LOC116618151 isoform X2 [Nematostella vectensis]|uniref:uncharacterized protein LOC116618151 isoform X2 n=1 Tax=Nematostella vectensis TaxID=45351 RepID=UPI0020771568|nr:uncharacterized protein LOC116618151 isoform X2 [Nematostella vectensis]